jgi:tRNA dimethylallyltransferase
LSAPDALLPLLVIAGPTASGKSALAVELAARLNGEIVSCDSVAVYREFEIGTAKPTAAERARVPHHLIDVAAPTEHFTAGEYARQARAALAEISASGRLPIVCGGTGLYLRALLEGLAPAPPRDEHLRERLRRRSRPGALRRLLRRLDPLAAARIHANDESKLVRAIEVSTLARAPLSSVLEQGRDPLTGYRVLRLALSPERQLLYQRINQRCARMFASGLVEETRGILARHGSGLFALGALGYRQAAELLRGECSSTEAVERAQQGHRNFAKRQLTWFRADGLRSNHATEWIEDFGEAAVTRALQRVEAGLGITR